MRICLLLLAIGCSEPEADVPDYKPASEFKRPEVKVTITTKPNWEAGTFDIDLAHDYGKPGKFKLDGPSFRLGKQLTADAKHAAERWFLRNLDGGEYTAAFISDDGAAYTKEFRFVVEGKPTASIFAPKVKREIMLKANWQPTEIYNRQYAELSMSLDTKLGFLFRGTAGDRAVIAGKERVVTGDYEDIEIDLAPILVAKIPKSGKVEIPITVIAKSGGPRISAPIEIDGHELLEALWAASKQRGFRIAGEPASRQHAVIQRGGYTSTTLGTATAWTDFDRILQETEDSSDASPCRYVVADGPDKGKPFVVGRSVYTTTLKLYDRRTGAVIRQQAFRGKLAPCPTRRTENTSAGSITDKSYDLSGREKFIAAAAR